MATVDFKDFYLSGSLSEVASDVSSLMEASLAALVAYLFSVPAKFLSMP